MIKEDEFIKEVSYYNQIHSRVSEFVLVMLAIRQKITSKHNFIPKVEEVVIGYVCNYAIDQIKLFSLLVHSVMANNHFIDARMNQSL